MTRTHQPYPQHSHICRSSTHRSRARVCAGGLVLAWGLAPFGHAATSLTSMSLAQLLEVNVVGASKYEQKQSEVAAAVSLITRDEIKAFGWRTLAEALAKGLEVSLTVRNLLDRRYFHPGADINRQDAFEQDGRGLGAKLVYRF